MVQSVKDRELILVGTMHNANVRMMESNFHNQKSQINFGKLYESVAGSLIPSDFNYPSAVDVNQKNLYVYCKSVQSYLNNVRNSDLNESFNHVNGEEFMTELNSFINKLENQNQPVSYSNDVLKIKTFTKQPIFVSGFNITDFKTILDVFDFEKQNKNIFAICYCTVQKNIYLLLENGVVNEYSIITGNKQKFTINNLNKTDYIKQLKEYTGYNTIILIWENTSLLGISYTDNMYKDNLIKEHFNYLREKNQISR